MLDQRPNTTNIITKSKDLVECVQTIQSFASQEYEHMCMVISAEEYA